MFSTFDRVSAGIMFSSTTSSPGCFTAKYGSAVTIMPNVCMSRDGLHVATSVLQHHFAQVHRAPLRRNRPQHVGQVFEPKLGRLLQPPRISRRSRYGCSCSPPWPRRPRSASIPCHENPFGRPAGAPVSSPPWWCERRSPPGLEPAVCAGAGTAANPRIPVTSRQIVAFFTLVLLFAASAHFKRVGQSSPLERSAVWACFWFVPERTVPQEDPAQPIK